MTVILYSKAVVVINGWLECLNRNVSDKTRVRHDNVNDIFRWTGIWQWHGQNCFIISLQWVDMFVWQTSLSDIRNRFLKNLSLIYFRKHVSRKDQITLGEWSLYHMMILIFSQTPSWSSAKVTSQFTKDFKMFLNMETNFSNTFPSACKHNKAKACKFEINSIHRLRCMLIKYSLSSLWLIDWHKWLILKSLL